MSQPPQPPVPGQSPIGPDSWWSEIESRPDVAPPRTATARSSAQASAAAHAAPVPADQAQASPTPPPQPSPGQSPAPAGGYPAASAPRAAASRPPVSYGVPRQSRKPYPIIILAMLLVLGVGAAGASLLSSQSRGTPPGKSSPSLSPGGTAPNAGPVPEIAPPAPAAPAPAPAAPAPEPQVTTPGPPLTPAPVHTTPPRAGVVRPHSGKVRDEDPQTLRRAFTRYFCAHGQLPASYCRSRS